MRLPRWGWALHRCRNSRWRARRRADVIALSAAGEIVIVEVKSGRADFQSDRKWPEYLEFCDRFFFAIEPDFPARHPAGRLRPDRCRCPWRRDREAGASGQAQRQSPTRADPGDRDLGQPAAGAGARSGAVAGFSAIATFARAERIVDGVRGAGVNQRAPFSVM